jgi:hypothetical protein
VISAAALVAHPPLLFRELGGAQDPVADLRAAALDAVRVVVRDADHVTVVGPADVARGWDVSDGIDVRRFGTTGERVSHEAMPQSLGVGVRLLDEAGWAGPVELVAVRWDAGRGDVEELAEAILARTDHTAVLLLGDGSARRGAKSPGHLDDRAFAFDDRVGRALAEGDASSLAGLDVEPARDLMLPGSATFRLLGELAGRQVGPPRATLTYRAAPHGVSYFTATWLFSRPPGRPGPLSGGDGGR